MKLTYFMGQILRNHIRVNRPCRRYSCFNRNLRKMKLTVTALLLIIAVMSMVTLMAEAREELIQGNVTVNSGKLFSYALHYKMI